MSTFGLTTEAKVRGMQMNTILKTAAFVMTLLSLLAGCTTAPENDCGNSVSSSDPYIGEPVFERCAGLSVSVDRTSYSIGDTLSLNVSFTTLYSGVAEVAVSFLPLEIRSGQQGIDVTEPAAAISGGNFWKFAVDIDAEDRFSTPITFVVNDNTPYHITATVRFTEVYDVATEQLYAIGSSEQEEALGPLDHTAYGNSSPLTLPRPSE